MRCDLSLFSSRPKHKVLGLHGWMDNCGTWDLIAPMLPLSEIDFLAIDLPGHGLSSHRGAEYVRPSPVTRVD